MSPFPKELECKRTRRFEPVNERLGSARIRDGGPREKRSSSAFVTCGAVDVGGARTGSPPEEQRAN
ncbi:hypothetical protein EYF80_043933 [Liparis tanakae]|uniref:Uncharacterized protein n=1 Tax=Liparis tanakae TaxID=230148 RepID=A0A4Z2FYT7_9TELE|nr:hypothetical protein EYF80_043933 [Liparis tanakae]